MDQRLTIADMLVMPFYQPALEEGLRGALRVLASDVPGAGGSDLSACATLGHDALD
ncbi:hypothetical protein ACVDG3_22325 [Meridianimarinicoccus sp. RP-17]|uniref:hypothetical protein n=1 Tax=Meridianimarinicoccus zhengii TaxID=2056810 RepID=UPI001C9B2C0D|nr:hypothetical protein [Phycocomes zhengii]